ncbi:MAG TPA: S-methyl-5-thioribose-1-phosphate isomerase [Bacillota bacterium]|nr:S-methyl-5-thioribose-1-phosphate isomerase [Bacillota bacterium]
METMRWTEDGLELIDQTKLPLILEYIKCPDYQAVAEAITSMQVRGAPAIGAAAAYGYALGARQLKEAEAMAAGMEQVYRVLAGTRPTAVNLFWALDRMQARFRNLADQSGDAIAELLLQEAHAILAEDLAMNRQMGRLGAELVPQGARILTHCNAGALATAGYGTALGVIRAAQEAGKAVQVYADETRPLLQGARLTAWELMQDNIPVTLITDNMAGYLMRKGMIDLVIVGADRITANGDVANKIGTYGVAVLAKEHKIPFYVAAPASTIDLSLPTGDAIPIEERHHQEVTHVFGQQTAPLGVKVFNPAFDVTPHTLIDAIITDRGVINKPLAEGLKQLFKEED